MPLGESTVNGRNHTAATSAVTAVHAAAARRPWLRKSHTMKNGTRTAGQSFAAKAGPRRSALSGEGGTREDGAEREPARHEHDERPDGERRGPEVESRDHDRAERQRRKPGEERGPRPGEHEDGEDDRDQRDRHLDLEDVRVVEA